MTTITDFNQSQANGISYAAAYIISRVKVRAWSVDVYATSYENAAKEVARSYFREGLEMHANSAAVFEVYRQDTGWKDKNPIICDLNNLNAGDWE